MSGEFSLTVAMIHRVEPKLGISADLLVGNLKSRTVATSARRRLTKQNARSPETNASFGEFVGNLRPQRGGSVRKR